MSATAKSLEPADYASDQQVRWCPGCGDYAILKSVQRSLAAMQLPKERQVFISGIGCSSRLPYYLDTYGFHTIHGRAPAVATGVKLVNPELDVWIITGDGDGLSIGGNHLLHILRRNLNTQILLFNNEIYGLTKGQSSPTSTLGTASPSTPRGSIESPVVPGRFVLGVGGRFFARIADTDQKRFPDVIRAAYEHKGAGFIEILQNCIVYNDKVFDEYAGPKANPARRIFVEHGKPLIFGENNSQGLVFNTETLQLDVIEVNEANQDKVMVHNATNRTLANLLVELQGPDFPVAMGVIYNNPTVTREDQHRGDRVRHPHKTLDEAALNELIAGKASWTV